MSMPRILLLALLLGAVRTPAKEDVPRVAEISFEGNEAFSGRLLKKVLLTREKGLLEPGLFRTAVFDDDLVQLERYYRLNGFLEAAVAGHTVERDTARNRVRISITVNEGEPTLTDGVAVLGNRAVADSVLEPLVKVRTGERLQQERIDRTVTALVTACSDRGYLDARVRPEVNVNRDAHRALVDFMVDEGRRYRVGSVRVRGLGKTRELVVRRELTFTAGEVISYARLLESQRNLYLTGLFKSVRVVPGPAADTSDVRDVTVNVEEAVSGEYGLGIGYGAEDRLRLTGDIQNRNLGGMGRRTALRAKVSMAGANAEATFTEPFTFGTRWQTDITLNGTYGIEPGYELVQTGARLASGRKLFRHSRMTLQYRAALTEYTDIFVTDANALPGRAAMQGITLRLARDTRDNLFNPGRGTLAEWENEAGRSVYEGTGPFLRTRVRTRAYLPLGPLTFAAAFDGGAIRAEGTVPLDERFYCGGPSSVRGFAYRGLGNVDADGTALGGLALAEMNAELRFPLFKIVRGVVFWDMGNVWSGVGAVRADGIRLAPGLGLRVDTALGVVRVDAGANPWPRAGEERWRFHAAMGQAF